MSVKEKASYDIDKTYEWNFENGPRSTYPKPNNLVKERVKIWDKEVDFPLFIPAGLLLNGRWVLFYEEMGFPILVYKTVRSVKYPSHPLPNCLVIKTDPFDPDNIPSTVVAPYDYEPDEAENVTITNSFGMPSMDPAWWQEDIDVTGSKISPNTLFVVSCVGTIGVGRSLVDDFVRVASMVAEIDKVHAVELNLSCPNVEGGEGILFKDPDTSKEIVSKVKKVIKGKPLIVKIGFLRGKELREFVKAVGPYVEAVSGINSISFKVIRPDGSPAFGPDRVKSGVCGRALIKCTVMFVRELVSLRREFKMDWLIFATGGVTDRDSFEALRNEGADFVGTCVGAMFDPLIASKIRGVV